jgi:hypothetical protein
LLAQMRNLDAQQAQAQVYQRFVFHLCNPCYRDWIRDPARS